MARREVLVQLDDELVERLDGVARRRHVSRSQLLREGALAVLEADETASADMALQQAYRRFPQDPRLVEAARRLAAEAALDW
jgi:metal-responsive CopG/Arc/MetJ family transcriptional regulator